MLTKVIQYIAYYLEAFYNFAVSEAQNFTVGVFVYTNAKWVDYYEATLSLFYYCFVQ